MFDSISMLCSIVTIIVLILPQYVHSSCCRLPFTDSECQVNRKGPHRYQIMPDRVSGLVTESTECYINDFNATYQKPAVQSENSCDDCPGLLVLHTNSSEIFLFPEYIERILEGRTKNQRKNVVILTTSLVGEYDLDFTLFVRYYSSRPIDEIPSIFIDLQLPEYNSKLEKQPNLRIRIPNYNEDKEESSKINRQDLTDPLINYELTMPHQLPYIYHFDILKHSHPPTSCSLYDVHMSSTALVWKLLESDAATCHKSKSNFGINKCFATGFTRLFCSIEQGISQDDRLEISLYSTTTNYVEHLTVAVTGGRQVLMSLSNDQMNPAQQIKILLLQGYLVITDINDRLPIRIEYGWNCDDFNLVVPSGFTTTRFYRFYDENVASHQGSRGIALPPCFRVVGGLLQVLSSSIKTTTDRFTKLQPNSNQQQNKPLDIIESTNINEFNSTNTTIDDQRTFRPSYWDYFTENNNLAYGAIVVMVLLALIPLCLFVFYRLYCDEDHKGSWTLEHGSHENPAFNDSNENEIDISAGSYVDNSTQTIDTPIRI